MIFVEKQQKTYPTPFIHSLTHIHRADQFNIYIFNRNYYSPQLDFSLMYTEHFACNQPCTKSEMTEFEILFIIFLYFFFYLRACLYKLLLINTN